MTVTVGTDTYISVAGADTYWSDRNNDAWSVADLADKEKALREATQFIDGAYSFVGYYPDDDQVLAWPRNLAYAVCGNFKGKLFDADTIPTQIEQACCELALEALDARLRESQERGGAVKREKVDVVEIEYMDFAPSRKSYDFVTLLLKPLLMNGGNSNMVALERS